MTTTHVPPPEPLLESLTVADAMHHGIVSCPPGATLREIAELLAEHTVHCAVVADATDDGPPSLWGLVSDVDLMRGLDSPVALTAGNLAAVPVVTVKSDDRLRHAARLMGEHDIAHLVVVRGGKPVGILSTLDIARAAASS
jgi:CBS domain-containing protein